MYRGGTLVLALVLSMIPSTLLAQEGKPATAVEAAHQLRTLYFHQDFIGGSYLADECLEQWPDNTELTMWATWL